MKKVNIKYIALFALLLISTKAFLREPLEMQNRLKSAKVVTAGCLPSNGVIFMELNNVRAMIYTAGDMWWDIISGNARYEVPKGSGKSSLFAGGIWVGGTDDAGQLRLSARTYRSVGNDYWAGPLTIGINNATVTQEVCQMFDRHFVITRDEVAEYKNYMETSPEKRSILYPNYKVPSIISSWPGNGPVEYGEYSDYLAPYKDVDGNGRYNPDGGDYPNYVLDPNAPCKFEPTRYEDLLTSESQKLFGDQTIWWVYNDMGNQHTNSTGAEAIGMEIRSQGFAFTTNDELNNMTFYNYQLINRSSYTLRNAYFGIWTDADLGDAFDDYTGCDVSRGLGFLYNSDNVDGNGQADHYGTNPPAIGIDFFEGPYQDPNGIDDPSYWVDEQQTVLNACSDCYKMVQDGIDKDGKPIYKREKTSENCTWSLAQGSINGLNFGDGVVDNERWGMRRFIYFNNSSSIAAMNDPRTAVDFYNYLLGKWLDGQKMKYGGNGYKTNVIEEINADFMFPWDSDDCNWGTNRVSVEKWDEKSNGDNPAGDRRFVQSAGPFTLEPGMVNDITIGAVWAHGKDNVDAVEEVKKADTKAQSLFDNCFQLIDGPDAPDVNVVELDNSFIFHLSNRVSSNNYLESYYEKDPFINPSVPEESRYYRFQGYQVYQVKNKNVTLDQIDDDQFAKLVFQCDLNDTIGDIQNFKWNADLEANEVVQKVKNAPNSGITMSFEVKSDLFATGQSDKLVNYKEYYFYAVAYAYNCYEKYNASTDSPLGKQLTPYLAGRKNIKLVTAMPQSRAGQNNGTKMNARFGEIPSITMTEGYGNGNIFLDLTDETVNSIMSKKSFPYKVQERKYKTNAGPVEIRIVDPLNVKALDYTLKLASDSVNLTEGYCIKKGTGYVNKISDAGTIFDTRWILSWEEDNMVKEALSSTWISASNEQIFSDLGIAVKVRQGTFPLFVDDVNQKYSEKFNRSKYASFYNAESINRGFVGSSEEWKYRTDQWIDFQQDFDEDSERNWIRSGSNAVEASAQFSDKSSFYNYDDNRFNFLDRSGEYEKVVNGKWAPYLLASDYNLGLMYRNPEENDFKKPNTNMQFEFPYQVRINSIDVVLTPDTSKWTRCCVVEMAENNPYVEGEPITNSLSEGNVLKFELRDSYSLNKVGEKYVPGSGMSASAMSSPNYVGEKGMSWFPGYAIDVNTGERLNIVFGEDSYLVGENGRDLLFNPTTVLGTIFNGLRMYGKHYIWIFPSNTAGSVGMPSYDEGRYIHNILSSKNSPTYKNDFKKLWTQPSWCAIGKGVGGNEYAYYNEIPNNELTIKIRVSEPFAQGVNAGAYTENIENDNYPVFKFSTKEYTPSFGEQAVKEDALEKVNIVPNPYYGFDTYETSTTDTRVKLINLPEKCTISIYNSAGQFVRYFDKDNSDTEVIWDLKNKYGIPIASGIYLIHIQAPEFGEKVLKWYGAIRPIDLSTF